MGLTIHYDLRSLARKPERVREQLARLRDRALDLPFQRVGDLQEFTGPDCDFERFDRGNPDRWLLASASEFVDHPRCRQYSYRVWPTHVIGFSTCPGEGCESADFSLCRYPDTIEVENPRRRGLRETIPTRLRAWSGGGFCKTVRASNPERGGVPHFLRCHLALVKLLDRAKELQILKHVSDECGYWEGRNVEALAKRVGEWDARIARWAEQLKDALEDQGVGSLVQPRIPDYPNFEHLEAAGTPGLKERV